MVRFRKLRHAYHWKEHSLISILVPHLCMWDNILPSYVGKCIAILTILQGMFLEISSFCSLLLGPYLLRICFRSLARIEFGLRFEEKETRKIRKWAKFCHEMANDVKNIPRQVHLFFFLIFFALSHRFFGKIMI